MPVQASLKYKEAQEVILKNWEYQQEGKKMLLEKVERIIIYSYKVYQFNFAEWKDISLILNKIFLVALIFASNGG